MVKTGISLRYHKMYYKLENTLSDFRVTNYWLFTEKNSF